MEKDSNSSSLGSSGDVEKVIVGEGCGEKWLMSDGPSQSL